MAQLPHTVLIHGLVLLGLLRLVLFGLLGFLTGNERLSRVNDMLKCDAHLEDSQHSKYDENDGIEEVVQESEAG